MEVVCGKSLAPSWITLWLFTTLEDERRKKTVSRILIDIFALLIFKQADTIFRGVSEIFINGEIKLK